MPHKYAEIAFTPAVKALQEEMGSRKSYARMQDDPSDSHQLLTTNEVRFIESRDSFYMATTSETGWPYIQHRGGAPGFIRALDATHLGFFDYRGNRQYISLGNLQNNDRVSLFFMDYARKARLKLLGHARAVGLEEAQALGLSAPEDLRIPPERAILIEVAGFDWNCPQHITERYTLDEVRRSVATLQDTIADLERQLAELKAL